MLKGSRKFWCRFAHKRTTWPMHGRYVCFECGTVFPVLWDRSQERNPRQEGVAARRWVRMPNRAYSAHSTTR